MTGPQGMTEGFARFRSDLDAAVSRGKRASAEANERTEAFRGRTRELTDQVRARKTKPDPGQLTTDDLRRVATGFRTSKRLPVEQLPTGAELLAPSSPSSPENVAKDTLRSGNTPGVGGRPPRPDDDDEDFSQERILS
ncbi:hypothetical protein F0L68_06280 [Solihabitans fulvus]|uniref:Uncharacterized protein n=1 Tax=Solihabitans fulvus TaxID=1892852 RepID=A0A5B2XNG2_9PSEU|nr:hypothetical protein [Solihabitans fulvus]KAA2264695.1 hypothetical protein F0L68_06280 [Solihabitans fulvus]